MMRFPLREMVAVIAWTIVFTSDRLPACENPSAKPATAETYLLQYRFRANANVHYLVTSKTVIRQAKGSAKAVVTNETHAEKHFKVTAVDDKGNALLEPVIDAVKLSAQFDDQPKKSFDSRSGKPPLSQFAGVARTIGKPLVRLKIAPSGKLLQAVPLIGRKTQAAVVKNSGPRTASNDPGKNFLVEFPAKPVRVGETWIDDSLKVNLQVDPSLRLFRTFVVLRTYKLKSVKDGRATIEFSMATKKPVNEPQLQVQLAQRLLTGTIVFDLKRGVIVSRTLTADNEVFGYSGPQSKLHVKMSQVEKLVEKSDVARGGKTDPR